jgi:hypothetical protein
MTYNSFEQFGSFIDAHGGATAGARGGSAGGDRPADEACLNIPYYSVVRRR